MLSGSIRQDDLPNSETKGYFPLTVANKKKTLKPRYINITLRYIDITLRQYLNTF